jgi:3-methyladenine DNA glycosylase AlkD
VFSALSQIAKHSVDLAEMVVEAEIFPASFACLKENDEYVKKNCATLIREVAKHTPEVCRYLKISIFFWLGYVLLKIS